MYQFSLAVSAIPAQPCLDTASTSAHRVYWGAVVAGDWYCAQGPRVWERENDLRAFDLHDATPLVVSTPGGETRMKATLPGCQLVSLWPTNKPGCGMGGGTLSSGCGNLKLLRINCEVTGHSGRLWSSTNGSCQRPTNSSIRLVSSG